MKLEEITFFDLEKLLSRLGFINQPTTGSQTVFQHAASNTLIILPHYEPQEPLREIHLLGTQKMLIEKDLISRAAFQGFMEKATP